MEIEIEKYRHKSLYLTNPCYVSQAVDDDESEERIVPTEVDMSPSAEVED